MAPLCPRSCCWLSTSCFFIFVGAVQLVAGLVLLRSKYVYLLAGPDFWTAGANIITGILLGIAASVWKKPRRKLSRRHETRVNIVTALTISSVILNATIATILILSEGNTMLAISLETSKQSSDILLGKEILRIAYVTSVVCPVICLIVATIALTDGCCPNNAPPTTPLKIQKKSAFSECNKCLEKSNPKHFDWVYKQGQNETRDSTRKSTSPSSSCSGSDHIETSTPKYPAAQSTPTVEELQCSISRLTQSHVSCSSSQYPRDESLDFSIASPTQLAGEVIPIQVRSRSPISPDAIPVEKPVTGDVTRQIQMTNCSSMYAVPTRVRIPKSNDHPPRLQRSTLSSFKAVQKDTQETEPPGSPKTCKKQSKCSAMESIIEIPTSQDCGCLGPSPTATSGYGSSPDVTILDASKEKNLPKSVLVEMVTPKKATSQTIPKELYGKTSLFQETRRPSRNHHQETSSQ